MRWRITCGPVLITRLREGTELTGTSEGGELSRDNMRNAGTDLGVCPMLAPSGFILISC